MSVRKPLPTSQLKHIVAIYRNLDTRKKQAIRDRIENAYLATLMITLILLMVLPR